MKTYEEIDVNQMLLFEDFFTLFIQLPLIEGEKNELYSYYQMYLKFIESEVKPVDAWVATKNIFVIKNQQIKERIHEN